MSAVMDLTPLDRQEPEPSRALAATTPAQLLQMAVTQGADLDRLERLMALQERWEANEARKAFVQAMADFKSEPLEIFKRKQVSFTTRDGDTTSYKHAELSDVAGVVVPAMARYGLTHRWEVKQDAARVFVTCTVTHRLGHSESVTLDGAPDASGKKNSIQQVASTITYLQRYTLLAIVGLATKSEDDDDGAGATAGAHDAAEMLAGFRDAALGGTAALRAHYEKVLPPDDWWAANSKGLKAAAKAADEKGGAQ